MDAVIVFRVVARNAAHVTVNVFAGPVEGQRPMSGVLHFDAQEWDEDLAVRFAAVGTVEERR